MSALPRVAAWSAAAFAAFLPSWWRWEVWRELHPLDDKPGLTVIYGLVRPPADFPGTPVLTPLLTDLDTLMEISLRWALPSVLVVAGLLAWLRGGGPEAVGRRVAWGLVAVAVVAPAPVIDPAVQVPSFEWVAQVAEGWGPDQVCYLLAAVLVLTGFRRPEESGLVDAAEHRG
ncbi:hypothetical protein OUY22_02875 [Nonomuraea sp. MCN248]|uniref:VanZ family protein n=1 Tax=Nonomuraea corallina TaxID=2989783 RepID=A0ABT4S589_9ACTN|nr:hypothetical protein [Nonomuraea corallina]MDA0632344.1 hypothetical protein [Nonomuraea corallina]